MHLLIQLWINSVTGFADYSELSFLLLLNLKAIRP